jgi:hypothetical protein
VAGRAERGGPVHPFIAAEEQSIISEKQQWASYGAAAIADLKGQLPNPFSHIAAWIVSGW